MFKRILLIDTLSILHQLKYSVGKRKLKKAEESSFIIYGFLFKLNALMNKSKANVVVWGLDSKTSKRRQLYANYKKKRHENKTAKQIELDNLAYPQFDEIINYVIPTLGYMNMFGEEGYESDDIIASICKKYKDNEIVIVTTDHDLYQLLTPNVCILNAKTDGFYSIKSFENEYGIEPKMWKRVKALGGCFSDQVSGVPIPQPDPTKKQRHVAEKGALNYIKGKMSPTTQAYKAIESRAGKDIINRNKALVILPFRGTPSFSIRPDRLRKKGLIAICKRYGFKAILSDIDSWVKSMRLR
jgi:5'-3' exonuclease